MLASLLREPGSLTQAIDHMIGTSGLLSDLEHPNNLPHITLEDDLTTSMSGLGIANLSPTLSISLVIYIPNFPFSLISVTKLTKSLCYYYTIFGELRLGAKSLYEGQNYNIIVLLKCK